MSDSAENGKFNSRVARIVHEDEERMIVEVPSEVPVAGRMTTAVLLKATNHIESLTLRVPTQLLVDYCEYQVRYGMLEREPTADEMDKIMRYLGAQMVEISGMIMTAFTRHITELLGHPDNSSNEARVESSLDSIMSILAKEGVPKECLTPEFRDEVRQELTEFLQDDPEDDHSPEEIAKRFNAFLDDLRERVPCPEEYRHLHLIVRAMGGSGNLLNACVEYAMRKGGDPLKAKQSRDELGAALFDLFTMASSAHPNGGMTVEKTADLLCMAFAKWNVPFSREAFMAAMGAEYGD